VTDLKALAAVLLGAALGVDQVSGQAPPPSAAVRCGDESAVDMLHHSVVLSLQLNPSRLVGQGEVRVRARRDTSTLQLDAHGLKISSVSIGARGLRFAQSDQRVCIELPKPAAAGEPRVLRIVWEVSGTAANPHFASDQIWAGYDAASWMPTVADSAQRATLALRLIAPTGLKVVASGRRLGTKPLTAARVAHSFAVDQPTPPFLFAFAAGMFDEASLTVDGFVLRALGPAGADLEGALQLTAPMLRFLVQHTGHPPPERAYTQVFVTGDAAQEAAGMALLSAQSLDDLRADPQDDWIFSHELAHQWFAYLVPCADFNDFWLNEGFATFMVAAIKEVRWGRAAYDAEVAEWRARSSTAHEAGRDAPLSKSLPNAAALASPRDADLPARAITYSRGALVLDKLRTELGEAPFWSGLKRYVKTRAHVGARSEDLRAAFEFASGRDLKPFFTRWVYNPASDL
jgi:aminopeptidase N